MKKAYGTILLLVAGMIGLASTAQAVVPNISITNESGSVFYTDLPGSNAVYLVFQLSNSGGPASDVWASLDTSASSIISNVGTGLHRLKFQISTGAHGSDPVAGTGLGTGETKGVFFLVKASATTAVNQKLTLKLSATNGGGNDLGSADFNFTVAPTIKANANKVNTVVTIPNNPTPGTLGRITVTGCTGIVGSQHVLFFSPVSADTWPADAFEFVDSDIQITTYPGSPYRDIALIPPADVAANSTNQCYDEVFTFVINGAGSSSTTPQNYVASGTQIKHTTNTSGSFAVVIPVTCDPPNNVTVVASPNSSQTVPNGSAIQTITFTASQTGGTTFTFAKSGALPTGVNFTDNGNGTATLDGTPSGLSASQDFSIVVTATNTNLTNPAGCQGTAGYTLHVTVPVVIATTVPAASPLSLLVLALVVGGLAFHLIRTRA